MKTLRTIGLVLVIAPVMVNAQSILDRLEEGATKATKAVGETAGSAASAVGKAAGTATGAVNETIEGTKESLRDEATPQETRAKLDAMAERTLSRLFDERPQSRSLFEQSAGYAVFDSREASLYVTAGYGRGLAVDRQTDTRTYMKMATAGAGLSFGFGDFDRQLVILFEDAAKLNEFVRQGYDASVGVSTLAGEQRDELALGFTEGKAVFLLTKKGWKVAAKLTGSRYWPDETLNVD